MRIFSRSHKTMNYEISQSSPQSNMPIETTPRVFLDPLKVEDELSHGSMSEDNSSQL